MPIQGQSPIIGITICSSQEVQEFSFIGHYVDAIRAAGGVPLLLFPGELHYHRILDTVDGLIFSGGGDIDPQHYDGSVHPSVKMADPERDTFELALARLVLRSPHASGQAPRPILGICRGLQVLAVASGGRLVPHVPDQFGDRVHHRVAEAGRTHHPVTLVPDGSLTQILGVDQTDVVSWHHQAIATVPPGWRASAHAPDGLVEAIESTEHPWAIALQWHPELSPANSVQSRIFAAFVQAARQRWQWQASYRVA